MKILHLTRPLFAHSPPTSSSVERRVRWLYQITNITGIFLPLNSHYFTTQSLNLYKGTTDTHKNWVLVGLRIEYCVDVDTN